ncbi:hypothetical protein [Pseudarthrobacter sp. C1]|uniref:hypothetical protein n=1 Tax=Pseudarthrobacter sp. C1 TaxID=3108940 RepID=UPI002B054D48|nr:hypothetical protein [Pseudarthrobacter sp. C1]MEA3549749.1 hypothetical protein [Pseudarthrobacter sp. C1]
MPATAGTAGWAGRRPVPILAAAMAALLMGGCSVEVRDPAAAEPAASTPAVATPTITPGHDAEAVAGRDLPFAAGGTLAPGVPVGISDGLKEAPGWKAGSRNVAGESRYTKADGCLVAAKARTNQNALARADDRESTIALFEYLDPSILPGYLKTETLQWGASPEGPGRAVEVLALEPAPQPGGRATAVLARLFGTAGSSVYVSISCPDAASLASARSDVVRFLPLVPPAG